MKKFFRQGFSFPLEKVLQAREDRQKHLAKSPELKKIHIIEEHIKDNVHYKKQIISVADELPAAIVSLLPGGAEFEEISTFDIITNIHQYQMYPKGNKSIFLAKGFSKYVKMNEERCYREYETEIISKVFLLGGMIEKTLLNLQIKNLEKDKRSLEKFIKMLDEGSV